MVCLSNQEGPAFDFGELQEAIVLQGVKFRNDEATKARMLLLPLLSLSLFSPLVTFDKNKHFPLKAKGLTISNTVMILLQYTWMLWSSKLGNFFTDSATAQRDLKKKKKWFWKNLFSFPFSFWFDPLRFYFCCDSLDSFIYSSSRRETSCYSGDVSFLANEIPANPKSSLLSLYPFIWPFLFFSCITCTIDKTQTNMNQNQTCALQIQSWFSFFHPPNMMILGIIIILLVVTPFD